MSKKIIIAEDEKLIRDLVSRIISKYGYASPIEIASAENGEDALKICKENNGIELLISDTDMPVMDGYELMKQLKSLYPDAKIIQMTGGANKKSEYADSFIGKPFASDELASEVGKYLKKNEKNLQ